MCSWAMQMKVVDPNKISEITELMKGSTIE